MFLCFLLDFTRNNTEGKFKNDSIRALGKKFGKKKKPKRSGFFFKKSENDRKSLSFTF